VPLPASAITASSGHASASTQLRAQQRFVFGEQGGGHPLPRDVRWNGQRGTRAALGHGVKDKATTYPVESGQTLTAFSTSESSMLGGSVCCSNAGGMAMAKSIRWMRCWYC